MSQLFQPSVTKADLIRSHTGLRGIAALLVVLYHLQYRPFHFAFEDYTTFFARSYLMVDLFFILSGFVMAYVRQSDSAYVMGWDEIKLFWWRRLVRIYPLHLLVLILMIIFYVVLSGYYYLSNREIPDFWNLHDLFMLGAQLILLNAWLPPPNAWNIPSWSISAEFVAYGLFPLLVLALVKARRVAITVAVVASCAFYVFGPSGPSLDITGGVGAPLRCSAGFTLGFLLHTQRDFFKRINDPAISIAQVATVGWILIIMIFRSRDYLVIPGFVFLVGFTWCDKGVVSRILGTDLMVRLGEISYAVYIMHLLILNGLEFFWDRTMRLLIPDVGLERFIFFGFAFASIVSAASLANKRVEKPARSMLMTIWKTRVTDRASNASAAS